MKLNNKILLFTATVLTHSIEVFQPRSMLQPCGLKGLILLYDMKCFTWNFYDNIGKEKFMFNMQLGFYKWSFISSWYVFCKIFYLKKYLTIKKKEVYDNQTRSLSSHNKLNPLPFKSLVYLTREIHSMFYDAHIQNISNQ